MLRVKGFERPGVGGFDLPAGQLVVLDPLGNPVVLAVEHGGGVLVSVAGDDDFEQACRAAGYKVRTRGLGEG